MAQENERYCWYDRPCSQSTSRPSKNSRKRREKKNMGRRNWWFKTVRALYIQPSKVEFLIRRSMALKPQHHLGIEAFALTPQCRKIAAAFGLCLFFPVTLPVSLGEMNQDKDSKTGPRRNASWITRRKMCLISAIPGPCATRCTTSLLKRCTNTNGQRLRIRII